jgi:hypothetical protein
MFWETIVTVGLVLTVYITMFAIAWTIGDES